MQLLNYTKSYCTNQCFLDFIWKLKEKELKYFSEKGAKYFWSKMTVLFQGVLFQRVLFFRRENPNSTVA